MSTPMIVVDEVHKAFGNHSVLRGVNLTVDAGDVVAILGPSGSGKSTLLRTINFLERPDQGWIWIEGELIGYRQTGRKLKQLKDREILKQRQQIGFVFQSFHLFSNLTVLGNVAEAPMSARGLSKRDAESMARQFLDLVGLSEKAGAYPRQLSGGQQQRVAIARALALRPKVMLLDEPTSALDPELVAEVLDVIRDLAERGTTMVIVTHEIAFARHVASRVVFMADGLVIESGPPSAVLDHPSNWRTRAFLSKVL